MNEPYNEDDPLDLDLSVEANPRQDLPLPDREILLCADDFQRIGVQPKETRLPVIRRAASRASKSLASHQLNAPNEVTEQQLSRMALSTYRVMDPRQRADARQRAHVGRIRLGALLYAERASFADGRILGASREVLTTWSESDGVPSTLPSVNVVFSASTDRSAASVAAPRWLSQPKLVVVMIVLLLLATAGLWVWGQTQHQRFRPWNAAPSSFTR